MFAVMKISVGPEYDITLAKIGSDQFDWLRARNYGGWVVVMDELTVIHCLPLIEAYLTGLPVVKIVVPQGEPHKHLETCRYIWEEMFVGGVGRRWCCLNLGGGVVGDMGGFAAATFKRGIDVIQLPTTVLSQVDSSVGGKLGIDFYEVKNSIGLFRNPEAVWVDVNFLQTLAAREIRSGYAEIVKHALIADGEQWDRLRQITDLGSVAWFDLIASSVVIKRDIVLLDPFERGLRKALNFGHTVGHAVESYFLDTEYRLLHGEAIAAGMIAESFLSTEAGLLDEAHLAEISDYLIATFGHHPIPLTSFPRLIELMRQDKKNESAEINFTFLQRPGTAVVNKTATVGVIERSLEFYNGLV